MTDMYPVVIPRDQHPVSRKLISDNALKVIHRLNISGHEAYLVGGGVRDILLGQAPKDFDIATSAHPEEVHALFKNSRLIGRRFKLVHILFGREMIEVATFRGKAESEDPISDTHQKESEHGMLLRDNVYGSIEEDAARRDFTANALYYSPKDFCIYDYVGGLQDIESRTLRLIGEPEARYREDPVRMLRAIRFASKLDFDLAEDAANTIRPLAPLLNNVAPARLFDEVLKLFLSGSACTTFRQLRHYDLFVTLFPAVDHTLNRNPDADYYKEFIENALSNTDKRIQQEKPVTPAFLYAALLWPEVHRRWKHIESNNVPSFPALQQAYSHTLQEQLKHISIPKRFSLMMKEIWEYQIRLSKTRGRGPKQLVQQPRFRAAYDFLLLREQSGEQLNGLGGWWTQFQKDNPAPVKSHSKPNRSGLQSPRSRRRRPGPQ